MSVKWYFRVIMIIRSIVDLIEEIIKGKEEENEKK